MFRELPPKSPGQPRALTPDMLADAKHAGRMWRVMGAIMGTVWTAVGAAGGIGMIGPKATSMGFLVPGLAIGFAGFVAWAIGWWMKSRVLDLFRNGDEVRGEVVAIDRDYMQKINKKHPWKVRYRYEVAGAKHEGTMTYWTDDPPAGLEPGREVVVLHAPDSAGQSLLWAAATPPLPDRNETHAKKRIDSEAWRGDPYAAVADAQVDAEAAAEAEAAASAPEEARS